MLKVTRIRPSHDDVGISPSDEIDIFCVRCCKRHAKANASHSPAEAAAHMANAFFAVLRKPMNVLWRLCDMHLCLRTAIHHSPHHQSSSTKPRLGVETHRDPAARHRLHASMQLRIANHPLQANASVLHRTRRACSRVSADAAHDKCQPQDCLAHFVALLGDIKTASCSSSHWPSL
jgi:hypothetical protein